MKLIFLGCTKFSKEILQHLITNNIQVAAICSIPEHFNISYSEKPVTNINFADLKPYAKKLEIPFFEIESKKGKRLIDFKHQLKKLNPDVIIAIGWYYMVSKEIRDIAKYGAWGIHASLLPNYAGGAPLVWAMIEGEQETGVTLFKLSDGIDDGDIIRQEKFKIEGNDTIREVYAKATDYSKKILIEVFNERKITFTPQKKSDIKIYPQRKPEDGEIDWGWDNEKIERFIKAQTRPYPGAWTIIKGRKVIIWDATIEQL